MTAHRPSRVRLEDVADRVGVSCSEVSRVLNSRERNGKAVGAETRERILRVASEMNYRPHYAAQNLTRGRTGTVGLMVVTNHDAGMLPFAKPWLMSDAPGELSPHYQEIIAGLTYTLNQYGTHLLLAQCGGPDDDPLSFMERIARSRVCDGLIITDMMVDDQRPSILERTGLPFVVRGTSPLDGVTAVGMDNIQLGRKAVEYLHGLGHRRILFFNIGFNLMSGCRRYDGARLAAGELGLEGLIEFANEDSDPGRAEALLLHRMRQPNPPTAIFATDELAAITLERTLNAAGFRIPEDVSIMTCLNARFMRLVAPRMTVLNLRQNEIASEAARLMARLLLGEPVERRQSYLSPILEERGSTGPPRA
jgi:DNA-binding LacI/PurR family transcriptional regulator